MPKSKPDSVVVHRIELQQHERESLDNFLIGKTATNALSAVGSVLTPFAGAIGAIVAAYIAKEGVDKFNDAWKGFFTRAGEEIVEPYRDESQYYRAVMAYLMAQPSAVAAEENRGDLENQIKGSKLVRPKVGMFWLKARKEWADWSWGEEAAQKWKAFYPTSQLMNDMKKAVKDDINPSGNRFIDWLTDRYIPTK